MLDFLIFILFIILIALGAILLFSRKSSEDKKTSEQTTD
jgi:cell division protein FtsW (lipid II flippase)